MNIGCMATYPARKESLKTTLQTICPQLDRLYLYLNSYKKVDFIHISTYVEQFDCEVHLYHAVEKYGDLKDMGKFYPLDDPFNSSFEPEDFIFLLDDDLIYPEDYCNRHIETIAEFGTITTVHGRMIKRRPMTNYFTDTIPLSFRRFNNKPVKVDIAGTGTVAFKYYLFDFEGDIPFYRFKKMADVYFSCLCKAKGLDILAIARGFEWITGTDNTDGRSIYLDTRPNTSVQCKIFNHYFK